VQGDSYCATEVDEDAQDGDLRALNAKELTSALAFEVHFFFFQYLDLTYSKFLQRARWDSKHLKARNSENSSHDSSGNDVIPNTELTTASELDGRPFEHDDSEQEEDNDSSTDDEDDTLRGPRILPHHSKASKRERTRRAEVILITVRVHNIANDAIRLRYLSSRSVYQQSPVFVPGVLLTNMRSYMMTTCPKPMMLIRVGHSSHILFHRYQGLVPSASKLSLRRSRL
jgi:hypothetical protein